MMTNLSAVANRQRVVIIGSGFGGLRAAKALQKADVDITLISRTTTHLFQPLLYQVATGILSEGEIAPTTRLILRKQANVHVGLGEVEAIDLQAKTVTSRLMTERTVTAYDSLIVAAGAQQSYFGNDHFATYAPGMKTIAVQYSRKGLIMNVIAAVPDAAVSTVLDAIYADYADDAVKRRAICRRHRSPTGKPHLGSKTSATIVAHGRPTQ